MSDDEQPKAPIERAIPFPAGWASTDLAAPNICLRSALFGVTKRGRRTVRDELLASVKGYTVAYTGERLDQFDEDVWLTALSACKDFGFGQTVPITLRGIAQRVGIGGGGKDVARVRRSLDRMLEGTVTLESPKAGFRGHLISSFRWDKEDEQYVIRLDPDLVGLFAKDQFTRIDVGVRMALGTYLSKWLHGFVRSHQTVFPYKVATLRDLCGSEESDLYGFRRKLREALAELESIGVINAWIIDKADLVHIGTNGPIKIAKTASPTAPRELTDQPRSGAGSDQPLGAGSTTEGAGSTTYSGAGSMTEGAGSTTCSDAGPDTGGCGSSDMGVRVLTHASAGSETYTPSKASEPESKPKWRGWDVIRGFFK